MDNILEVKNLSKRFKDFTLNNISFSLPKGYIMGFIGPNGAGKSTTIKLIMNLLKKDSGEINILGLDNIKYEQEIKNRIGFVYDENYYYEDLTIMEVNKFISSIYRTWNDDTFNKYLTEFDLSSRKKIKDLSKGMKMKFSLAIALSHGAELLIMDEPTSGLDHMVRNELLDILSHLMVDEKKGVFFSTHITSDLDKIADYITFINDGKIIFSTDKEEILDSYAIVKGDYRLLDSATTNHFIGIKKNKFGFEGLIKDRTLIKEHLRDQLLVERPTLENIMVHYVGGK